MTPIEPRHERPRLTRAARQHKREGARGVSPSPPPAAFRLDCGSSAVDPLLQGLELLCGFLHERGALQEISCRRVDEIRIEIVDAPREVVRCGLVAVARPLQRRIDRPESFCRGWANRASQAVATCAKLGGRSRERECRIDVAEE